MLFVANFTALSYGPQGKTPDFSCSNNYGRQFIWRVGQLNERLSALTLRQQDVPKCASSNIDIIVGSKDLRYFSEYSHVCYVMSVVFLQHSLHRPQRSVVASVALPPDTRPVPSCECLSVCLSVCLSQERIVSKRLNIFSNVFHPRARHCRFCFPYQTLWKYYDGYP